MSIIHISGDQITMVYNEKLNLSSLGKVSIKRASNVEPNEDGTWRADLSPSRGPTLTNFKNRSEALSAEVFWIENNMSVIAEQERRPIP